MSVISNSIELADDIELAHGIKEYPNGFATVAFEIAEDPDNTTTIYRRLNRLTARNLLYLQAKLQKLEADLDVLDREDFETQDENHKRAATSWEDFESLKTQGNQPINERMEKVMEIEGAIRTYQEALLRQSKVLELKALAKNTLKAFKMWFKPDSAQSRLRGHSAGILDNESDLVALRDPANQDRLTSIVQTYFPWLFLTETPDGPIVQISEQRVARFVAFITSLLAATLLIGAIATLYRVRSQGWRIALIGIFTVMFAGSVGLLTAASKAEVFAATAAYAAVLAVFISENQTDVWVSMTRYG